jgi:hypothetical protein
MQHIGFDLRERDPPDIFEPIQLIITTTIVLRKREIADSSIAHLVCRQPSEMYSPF